MKHKILLIGVLVAALAMIALSGCDREQSNVVSSNDLEQTSITKEDANVSLSASLSGYPNFSFGLNIPFMTQVPYGDWANTKNCGQASSAMIGGYFKGTSVNAERVKDINRWLANYTKDNRYLSPNGYYTGGSRLNAFRQMIKEYYGLNSFVGYGSKASTLVWNVYYGYPVIVGVMIRNGNLVSSGGVAHWAVVVGWDGKIIVHDPGSGQGRYRRYTVAEFEASWATQGKIYMPISK